jgi:hypothetical protein
MRNNILKTISYLILSIFLTASFVSCEPVESVPDASDIAIDDFGLRATWVVEFYWDGDYAGENTIRTYNTGDNLTSEFWLDDIQHGWGLLTKINVNPNDLTFSGTDLDELYYGVTVTITEGKITKDGATTPSGDVVDSIYFKAEFSDIPGEIWEYTGYKSTAKINDYP